MEPTKKIKTEQSNNYKLGYWKIRGLGFKVRIVLEFLGLEYEIIDYEQGDAPEFSREPWLSKKFNLGLDFPNLPYLESEEGKLSDTRVIIQYLVNKHDPKLGGRTPFEQAQVNMVGGIIHENIYVSTTSIAYRGDKEQYKKSLKENDALKRVVDFLGDKKYLVSNDQISWADLHLYDSLESFAYFTDNEIYNQYPTLKKFHDNISELSQIKQWKSSDRYYKTPFNNKSAKLN